MIIKVKYFISSVFFFISVSISAQSDCNCCSSAHQAFDFWVGDWQVVTPDNTVAGSNSITREQDGCVIRENWVSVSEVYTGTSYNFYNNEKEQWEQIWLDNSGSILKLAGNRVDNQMILESEKLQNEDGDTTFNRITWTLNEDGTVNQLWELLTEDEEAKILFDGLYLKKT